MKAYLIWNGMGVHTQQAKAMSQIKVLEKILSLPSYVYTY